MSNPEQAAVRRTNQNFELREATNEDFEFARSLYFDSMKPLLSALDAWDAEKAHEALKSYFVPDEIKIIQVDGRDAGWMQVSQTERELCLDQIHLIKDVRGHGIGTELINSVIDSATEKGLNVSLSLIKGNPSLELYRRLGFRVVADEETKYHMHYRTEPNQFGAGH